MGPLAAVERFLERLFERQAARFFKTAIRPIQVQRRLERAMEGSRVRDGARTLVPHRFTVRLAPADLSAIRSVAPSLAADLADGALAFARGHGYSLLDRPTVALRSDPSVELGDIAVDAVDPARRGAEADEARPDRARADPSGLLDDLHRDEALDASAPVLPEAGRVQAPGAAASAPGAPSAGGAADQTAVFVVPSSDGPRAIIRETRADGSSRTIAFDGRPMTIGRAPDNRLVLRDGRASRHHARIDGRRGTLVLSDLGSTNGSFVNDRRVESVALGAGDRIRIGTTALVVEAVGDEVDVDVAEREGGPSDPPSATGRGSSDASAAPSPNPS